MSPRFRTLVKVHTARKIRQMNPISIVKPNRSQRPCLAFDSTGIGIPAVANGWRIRQTEAPDDDKRKSFPLRLARGKDFVHYGSEPRQLLEVFHHAINEPTWVVSLKQA